MKMCNPYPRMNEQSKESALDKDRWSLGEECRVYR